MKQFNGKQIVFWVALLICGRCCIADVYPLVAAVFMTGIVAQAGKGMLLVSGLAGLLLFVPVLDFVKYSLILLVMLAVVKWAEWSKHRLSDLFCAVLAGSSVFGIQLLWTALHLQPGKDLWVGLLESIFATGFVHAFGRYAFLLMSWNPQKEPETQITISGADRLAGYAESFAALSKTFNQMNRYKADFSAEELGRMQSEVTGRLCVSCGQCSFCWESENPPMYQVLYRFLQKLQKGQVEESSRKELDAYCQYSNEMIEQVMHIFEKARLNMAWYNRLQENRDVIAQQLTAMSYIMKDCARENRDISGEEGKLLAQVKYQLKEAGIVVEQLRLLERANGKKEFLLLGRTKTSHCVPVREVVKKISAASGYHLVSAKENRALMGPEELLVTIEEDTRYGVYYGISRATRDGEQVSGDNFSFLEIENNSFVMSLSDGMGSGLQACKESEMVIDLMEKFLEAGFQPDTAIRMMNSAMVTHGEHNLFSTVDVLNIDLDSGQCESYKVGAATTFLVHRKQFECLVSTNPPVGVFSNLEIQQLEATLQDGDIVLMVSDGVLEHLHVPDVNAAMEEIMKTIETENPSQIAKQVLERVLLYTGGQVRDDMTVLAAVIWEKRK